MLTPDDAARVQAIAGRLAERTPGTWHYRQLAEVVYDAGLKPICALDWVEMTDADGFFIAAAPDDVDYLLALVERLTQGQARDEANIGIPF